MVAEKFAQAYAKVGVAPAAGDGFHAVAIDVSLDFVGQQHVDHVGLLGGFFDGNWLESVLYGQLVVGTAGTLANDDGTAAVTQVLSLGVALAAVSQNGDRLALEHGQIGVIVVVDLDRHG